MITENFSSTLDLFKAFLTDLSCIDHFEELRWNGFVIIPFDSTSQVYKCKEYHVR